MPIKGMEYLIDAASLMAGGCPPIVAVVGGTGPVLEDLRERAQRLGLRDRVRFVGFCSDAGLFYDAIDVLVSTSLSEALPYVLIEGMSHGLPIVATAVGGIPEIVTQDETGLLIPPKDPGRLAAALKVLAQAPDLRDRMGAAGHARAIKHFQQSECVRRTIDIYRQMLGRGPSERL
jgi:glycosyltransferase involved in cell wall biosynthesis